MVHKLALIAVLGLTGSAVCMGAAAAIGGREFGKGWDGVDFSMFGDRPRCEIHPLSIGARDDPVRLVFTAAPGPAVVVGMLDLGTRFRIVANEVDVVPPDEDLPKLPVARAVWRPRPSFTTAAEAWLEAGGPHHTVLTRALPLEVFEDVAEIAGIELISIGESTTVRGIKHELRWNAAYYHLDRAL